MFNSNIESRAILLHREKSSNAIEVTSHDVISLEGNHHSGNSYTLGAGQLFGPEQKTELSNLLAGEETKESLSLIDSRVIAQTSYAIIWWMPAQVRTITQRKSHKKHQFTIKTPNAIGAMCRGDLYVAAYKGKAARPEADTPLFRAPLSNLTSDLQFCMGNIRIPKDISTKHIETWTDAIWSSTNTHLGRSPLQGINNADDFIAILSDYHNTKRFPNKRLVALNTTVAELLGQFEQRG